MQLVKDFGQECELVSADRLYTYSLYRYFSAVHEGGRRSTATQEACVHVVHVTAVHPLLQLGSTTAGTRYGLAAVPLLMSQSKAAAMHELSNHL